MERIKVDTGSSSIFDHRHDRDHHDHRDDHDGRMWFLLSPDHLVTVKQGDDVVLPVWSSGEAARKALASSTDTELLDLCCVTLDDWHSRWVPSLRREKIGVGTDWSNVHGGEVDSYNAG